jgi:hypothetical protein
MIPWSFLLKNSPLILAGADALLARLKSGPAQREAGDPTDRLSRLEESSAETARLLHQLAQHVDALAAVQRATAKRAQLALVLSLVATALSAGAFVMIWLR